MDLDVHRTRIKGSDSRVSNRHSGLVVKASTSRPEDTGTELAFTGRLIPVEIGIRVVTCLHQVTHTSRYWYPCGDLSSPGDSYQ